MDGKNDFDFIIGEWKVSNKRLKKRLCACEDWISFEADYKSWHVLNGLGNVDEMKLDNGQELFYGMSIRMFNPQNNEWTIYWADSDHPEIGLKVQVTGRFDDGIGVFYGEEIYQNKLFKLRFIWKSINPDHAAWEQAYFDENKTEWETNWTMDFYKK